MQANQLKVIFQNETKKFRKPADYDSLYQQTVKAFGATLPKNFKFFYQDPEGDLISISCQEDLEEAYSSMPQLRLFVEASIENARQQIEPDFSMRSSSLNMPIQMSNQNFDQNQKSSRGISHDFEDVSYEEQKSHQNAQVNSGFRGNEASTDVNNLVNFQNIGCGANIQTDEKQLNAVVDTKEMGSQIIKEVKEVCCDGSVQTESKGSQIKTEAISQEVNCQILRPEHEEEQISEEETIVCFRCDGTKVNRKGLPCRRCNGSGTLNNKFYQDLFKVLKEEIKSYTTQTFQRLMVDYLGKRAADQAAQVHASVTCDGCQANPIQGIRYKCSQCPDFDFCEKCEAEKQHPHPMLKIRRPEQAPAFISCQYQNFEQVQNPQMNQSNQSQNSQSSQNRRMNKKPQEKKIYFHARFVKENFGDRFEVAPGQVFLKSWTFRNNGDTEWPEDTTFIQTNGDDIGATSSLIRGPVKPNQEIEVSMELIAPKLPGKYCSFFRFVHGNNDRFGQKVWCDILVKENALPKEELKNSVFIEEKQERSSLLNENEQSQELNLQEPLLKLENLAEKIQPKPEEPKPLQQLNFEEILQMDNKDQDLNLSQEVEKVEEKLPEQEEAKNEMKESFMEVSQEEKDKQQYLVFLNAANINDQKLVDNLKYMMEIGYTNFQVNLSLLRRNNNDLVVAINNLCNGLVSDSMFQQQ